MNALSLSVFSTIIAGTLSVPAPAIITVIQNRLYSANDHILSATVSSDRPFTATILSYRSIIEDTPSHFGVRVPYVAP